MATKSNEKKIILQQMEITRELSDIILEDLRAGSLKKWMQIDKNGSACEGELEYVNEERLLKIVRALGDIFELQRLALGIPVYKEKSDNELGLAKIELERQKIKQKETPIETIPDDGFLDAIRASF